MAAPAGQRDLVEVLVKDHREVEDLFAQLESGTQDDERRRELTEIVIAELVRHSVAEEEYLYPTARRVLPNGNEIADHEIEEHAEAERTMKDLERLEVGTADFEAGLSSLISTIRHHLQEEEENLFPRLRAACSTDELRELGEKVETAKKIAPTRPHPSAPDRPPMNKMLAPGAGLVDRIRDAVTGRPTSTSDA